MPVLVVSGALRKLCSWLEGNVPAWVLPMFGPAILVVLGMLLVDWIREEKFPSKDSCENPWAVSQVEEELAERGIGIGEEVKAVQAKGSKVTSVAVGTVTLKGTDTTEVNDSDWWDENHQTYTFTLYDTIPIVRFERLGFQDKIEFETFDLTFTSKIVGGTDGVNVGTLQITSTEDPMVVTDVPFEYILTTPPAVIPKRKLVKPNLTLGAQLALEEPTLAPTVGLTWLHPLPSMDLLSPNVGLSRNPSIGLEVLSLRVPVPLTENLWVFGGTNVDSNGAIKGTVGLRTNL